MERGFCVGDEVFARELLNGVATNPSRSHYGEAVQEAVEVRAERLVKGRLKAMGMERRGFGRTAQRRPGEGEIGGPCAGRDNDAAGVDSGASGDGQSGLSDLAAPSAQQRSVKYDNTIN
jgi:hypothetical protein